ncbi:MAG: ABC transporter ATP-binding protein [Prevotella sp.]|nr:ABC transporter ATP-binding protein [Prevotella sp.]
MIEIKGLKKQFGETVACDIPEFTINSGDILGLVGNNGAGKTTLFRLLLDLLKADEGGVLYHFAPTPDGSPSIATTPDGSPSIAPTPDGSPSIAPTPDGSPSGINPAESEAWKQHVGAYIDEGFLIDFLTPEEYFAFLGKISNIPQTTVNERLQDFERFAAGELFGQKKLIRNLSAGNKMKVGIISALLRQPSVVILDEPFNFLDPTSQLLLKHLLTDYRERTGATILISSHNLQHTIDISSRIALLEHGQIIRDLPNEQGNATEELEAYFNAE